MATKKKAEEKKAQEAAPKKKVMTEDEKKAKREKMRERLKNRPEGQRPNSRQCDVIELGNGSKVMTYAMNVRKFGVVLTSVVVDEKGNAISSSLATFGGVSVKVKKGHGMLVPKVPGVGKHGKGADADDEVVDEATDDEDEE